MVAETNPNGIVKKFFLRTNILDGNIRNVTWNISQMKYFGKLYAKRDILQNRYGPSQIWMS